MASAKTAKPSADYSVGSTPTDESSEGGAKP